MSLANLTSILNVFRGDDAGDEQSPDLFKETLLMTLSRATSADSGVRSVEVDEVRRVFERETGETVSEADVRVAAASELYESARLDSYLGRATKKLQPAERARILQCLAEVIKSDVRISPFEIEYYDLVANALRATPSEIRGLIAES